MSKDDEYDYLFKGPVVAFMFAQGCLELMGEPFFDETPAEISQQVVDVVRAICLDKT
jgi:hypothetical protein